MTAPAKSKMRKCHEGKQRYPTLQQTQAAAHIFVKRKAKTGNAIVSKMNAYGCAYGCACGGFHIGKSRDIDWKLLGKLTVATKLSDLKDSPRRTVTAGTGAAA